MIRSRLFRRTLLGMLVLFGFYALAVSAGSDIFTRRQLMRESEATARAVAQSIAGSSMDSLYGLDPITIQSRIDQYLSVPGVRYALVTASSGDIVAHTFAPVVPEDVRALARSLSDARKADSTFQQYDVDLPDGSAALHCVMPVYEGLGGYVHIGMDRSSLDSHVGHVVRSQQILALVFFCVAAFASWFFLQSISRPLAALTDYARKVAAHEFPAPVEVKSRDEIGTLARVMGFMAADLARFVGGLEAEVKRSTGELRTALGELSAIVGGMGEGLLVVSAEGLVLRSNEAFASLFCLEPFGCPVALDALLPLSGQDDSGLRGVLEDALQSMARGEAARHSGEYPFICGDGVRRWVGCTIEPVTIGAKPCIVCLVQDVTARNEAQQALRDAYDKLEAEVASRTRDLRRANAQLLLENAERRSVEQALRRAEQRYRGIFENAVEGIFQIAPDGMLLRGNPAMAEMFGYTDIESLREVGSMAEAMFAEATSSDVFFHQLEMTGNVSGFEFRARHREDRELWLRVNARRVADAHDATLFYEGFLTDITISHRSRQQLAHQAYHDPLTGLPNRLLFLDHLQLAMQRAARRTDAMFTVLYLDLDRFKIINDSLGHGIGDALLREVACTLRRCVRDVDTVARFGGDEFAILLEDTGNCAGAVRIARRIRESLAQPVNIAGHEVFTTASIGIVLQTRDYLTPEDILRDADTAMYRAKEMGKSRFKVFNARMREDTLRLMALETDLRFAVERGELSLRYHPIVDLEDGSLHGFESLLRWRRGNEDVSPAEFIPVAEDAGLIADIGAFVIEDVCRQVAAWQDTACDCGIVHVNISGRQLMRPGFAQMVDEILRRHGIAGSCLRFEVTESVLVRHGTLAVSVMHQLRELGIRLCLDDFGTGYSSLGYLRRLPVESLKIDRSFVWGMEKDEAGRALVRGILTLGLHLGLEVVAEGVETEEQAVLLRDMGCRYGQGFLYAKPLLSERVPPFVCLREAAVAGYGVSVSTGVA
ncbi:MAG TPA: sensor domain-containing diguanylate cyclase [Desulfovibrio sp.]|nr:sensor domain-containing diguanylate cyclase [Desulfovibrio sp.]